jgi:hypothetical protein
VAPTVIAVEGAGLTGLDVAVTYPAGGASGWLDARLSGTATPAEVELVVDPGVVPPGDYQARVDVSAAGSLGASIQVSYAKRAEIPRTDAEAGGIPVDQVNPTLDRLDDRLLDSPSPASLAALNDTAQAVWAMGDRIPDVARARAAFYAAQAESALGNTEEARSWAERAVALVPDNDGYRILLESLGGGRP